MWVRPVYHTQAFIFLRGDFRMRKERPALFCRYALPQAAGLLLNSVYFIVDGMFTGTVWGGRPWRPPALRCRCWSS